jgi:predicted RNA-binding protein YlqC (UPF0109 family)|tara:strand:- start:18422 stop:18676 length:255 start_codon:yes stop_codon:yes gene_type:complete
MQDINSLIKGMVCAIVDKPDSVSIFHSEDEKGHLYEVEVDPEDIGKVIGKQGRIASAIRTVAKASGAKNGVKVMVNVLNKPRES